MKFLALLTKWYEILSSTRNAFCGENYKFKAKINASFFRERISYNIRLEKRMWKIDCNSSELQNLCPKIMTKCSAFWVLCSAIFKYPGSIYLSILFASDYLLFSSLGLANKLFKKEI